MGRPGDYTPSKNAKSNPRRKKLYTEFEQETYNKLPFFMKKIYTRVGAHSLTEETLKMNHFSNGKFSSNFSSFWPHKSFNKIINLNIMNSEKFIENAFGNKKNMEKKNDILAKSMKFYTKNYEELLKESLLSKFDNVTYKSIPKFSKIDEKDLERFMNEYEQNELKKKNEKKMKIEEDDEYD